MWILINAHGHNCGFRSAEILQLGQQDVASLDKRGEIQTHMAFAVDCLHSGQSDASSEGYGKILYALLLRLLVDESFFRVETKSQQVGYIAHGVFLAAFKRYAVVLVGFNVCNAVESLGAVLLKIYDFTRGLQCAQVKFARGFYAAHNRKFLTIPHRVQNAFEISVSKDYASAHSSAWILNLVQ